MCYQRISSYASIMNKYISLVSFLSQLIQDKQDNRVNSQFLFKLLTRFSLFFFFFFFCDVSFVWFVYDTRNPSNCSTCFYHRNVWLSLEKSPSIIICCQVKDEESPTQEKRHGLSMNCQCKRTRSHSMNRKVVFFLPFLIWNNIVIVVEKHDHVWMKWYTSRGTDLTEESHPPLESGNQDYQSSQTR